MKHGLFFQANERHRVVTVPILVNPTRKNLIFVIYLDIAVTMFNSIPLQKFKMILPTHNIHFPIKTQRVQLCLALDREGTP